VRILLVRLRPLGDVVFTTPLVGALRRHHPTAHLTYLVEPDAAPVLEHNPDIDTLVVVPRRRGIARLRDDVALGARLARGGFDLAIDLHGGPRSAWFTWASRAPRRIGYTITGRTWTYTTAVHRPRQLTPRHSVMNQWDLLAPLGIAHGDPTRDPVRMHASADAARRVSERLERCGVRAGHTVIAVHVSASNHFKRWPEDSFAALLTGLLERHPSRRAVLIAGPADREPTRRVVERARALLGDGGDRVIEPGRLDLHELRALADRADAYVGGDSGPLHIAATTDTPIVELLGPTLPERSHPWRDPRLFAEMVEAGPLPCRPCDQRRCAPGDFRCLSGIGPERVIAAVERALAARVNRGGGIERRIAIHAAAEPQS
jgi:ADP-heptose:LPS heptosyltransferase